MRGWRRVGEGGDVGERVETCRRGWRRVGEGGDVEDRVETWR